MHMRTHTHTKDSIVYFSENGIFSLPLSLFLSGIMNSFFPLFLSLRLSVCRCSLMNRWPSVYHTSFRRPSLSVAKGITVIPHMAGRLSSPPLLLSSSSTSHCLRRHELSDVSELSSSHTLRIFLQFLPLPPPPLLSLSLSPSPPPPPPASTNRLLFNH